MLGLGLGLHKQIGFRKAGGSVINPFVNAVAYYAFEETTGNLIDLVNNHDGVLSGGITRGVTGKVNNGYKFNGVNGRITLPISIYNDFNNNNYTVGFWVNITDVTVTQLLISDVNNFPNFTIRKLSAFVDNSRFKFGFGDNGVNIAIESINQINSNQWYFVMLKYNGNDKAEFYVNNVLQAQHVFVNAPISNNEIDIACRKSGVNTYTLFANAIMDEMFFINGQTTPQQDALIYNNGNGRTL